MTKEINAIALKYTYNPEHTGAPYTLDNNRYFNAGELNEIVRKSCKGLTPKKDGNGKWCDCSDIPELCESVKSSKATLCSEKIGKDFDEIVTNFINGVASVQFSWNVIVDDVQVTYIMNKSEFETFVRVWASFAKDRRVVRFKATSGKMLAWLDERVTV